MCLQGCDDCCIQVVCLQAQGHDMRAMPEGCVACACRTVTTAASQQSACKRDSLTEAAAFQALLPCGSQKLVTPWRGNSEVLSNITECGKTHVLKGFYRLLHAVTCHTKEAPCCRALLGKCGGVCDTFGFCLQHLSPQEPWCS